MENVTPDVILKALAVANKTGNAVAAADLRKMLTAAYQAEVPSPTEGMSPFELGAANIMAGFTNPVMGIKQLAGMATGEDAREKARIDAELANALPYGIGHASQFVGEALPLALIPAAATVAAPLGVSVPAAAALTGAVSGAIMPTQMDNTSIGKAVNAFTGALGNYGVTRYAPTIFGGVKKAAGAARDFMAEQGVGSIEKLAKRRFMEDVASDAGMDAATAAAKIRQGIADDVLGTSPTTAQLLGNRRMLTAEKAVREASGEASEIFKAQQANANSVRLQTLRNTFKDDPQALRDAAANWFRSEKANISLKPEGFDPKNTFRSVISYQQNNLESPDAKIVLQKLKDRLAEIRKAPASRQFDLLLQFRRTGIDEELSKAYESNRNIKAILREPLQTIKDRFDDYMERATASGDWRGLMAGYNQRMTRAEQAAAGRELLEAIEATQPLSTLEPNVMAKANMLRNVMRPSELTTKYKTSVYGQQGEDAINAVIDSLNREALPYAADVGAKGSNTAANINSMLKFGQARNAIPSLGEIGALMSTGILGMSQNPVLGTAMIGATIGQRAMANNAQQKLATLILGMYRDPQVALAALDQMGLPKKAAEGVRLYLLEAAKRGSSIGAGVLAPVAAANEAFAQ